MPNARNLPRSTSHTNIWYHLGLVHYLTGELEAAARSYRECLAFSENDDMRVATAHWLYMTLRRLGRDDEAARLLEPIDAEMEIIENDGYHRLLLMYKGLVPAEELEREAFEAEDGVALATVAYGVANWHDYNGRAERALELYRRITRGSQWAAFGHIAAEADLARRMTVVR
jgi:tetratricopeptide (TPR) repeat protein